MSYAIEWAGPVLLGGLVLLLVPGFALIAVVIVALAAVAAVLALAGAIVASPYLILRTVRRRHAEGPHANPASQTTEPAAGALTPLPS